MNNYFDTLIIGSGISGLTTALELAENQISSLILEQNKIPGGLLTCTLPGSEILDSLMHNIRQQAEINLQSSAKLNSISGSYPSFNISWTNGDHSHTTQTKHIVFATGLSMTFPLKLYPIEHTAEIITLPELETRLINVTKTNINFKNRTVLMTGGFQNPAPAFSTELMIDRSIRLTELGARVILAVPDILFDSPETAALYRISRQHGVLIIKTNFPPEIFCDDSDLSFKVIDSTFSHDNKPSVLSGSVNLVVLEPEYKPITLPELFWSPHHPFTGKNGYYRPDNPSLGPVCSERKGIYFAGSVTGFKSLIKCREEASLAVSEILSEKKSDLSYAEIDEKKCAICLTCVRICPHHAIRIETTARVFEEACDACGICVAECPAKAISLNSSTNHNDYDESKTEKTSIIMYVCDGSSWPTWNMIKSLPEINELNLSVVRVTCSGSIKVSSLLEHFKAGISAVLVAACQPSCCNHIHGNRLAENRIKRVKTILSSIKLNPERVELIHVAHGMQHKLRDKIISFCNKHRAEHAESMKEIVK